MAGRRLLMAAVAWGVAGLAAPCAVAQNPSLVPPVLQPPPENARAPRATVRYAPYRYDDILWENDLTAHRIYGPALQAYEPPSGSGVDAWGKQQPWPFMERQLATGHQHDYHGEGVDFYNVGGTRGVGGIGIWHDNKLWVSRNWASHTILQDGPDVADFEVRYAPWPVDVGRRVWETRRMTLPLGTHFTRAVSTVLSDKPDDLIVGVGIGRRVTAPADGHLTIDRAHGRIAWWSPTDPDKGAMGVALMVDPAMLVDVVKEADNVLALLRVRPGQAYVYYLGAAWSKGRDMQDEPAWLAYVAAQKPDFAPPQPQSPKP